MKIDIYSHDDRFLASWEMDQPPRIGEIVIVGEYQNVRTKVMSVVYSKLGKVKATLYVREIK